ASADDIVLLGMGGSSLAPEVLRRAFERDRFHVVDTTHPKAIRRLADALDLGRTLFVVSSKSGGTLETRSHFDFFWERGGKRSDRFIAITDPGSPLEQLAKARGARVFAGEPTIGGRYSALSPFGLVPAALMGLDDPYDLGSEFFRWEFATAVAGAILEINPFDQPNVQEAKDRTSQILGTVPETRPEGTAEELFAQARPGDYVAIQAFVDPAEEE